MVPVGGRRGSQTEEPTPRLYRTLHGDNGTFKAISRLLLTGHAFQNNMTCSGLCYLFATRRASAKTPDGFVEKYAFVCGVLLSTTPSS